MNHASSFYTMAGWILFVFSPLILLGVTLALGRLAQLGEHRHHTPGVTGSIPVPPTAIRRGLRCARRMSTRAFLQCARSFCTASGRKPQRFAVRKKNVNSGILAMRSQFLHSKRKEAAAVCGAQEECQLGHSCNAPAVFAQQAEGSRSGLRCARRMSNGALRLGHCDGF